MNAMAVVCALYLALFIVATGVEELYHWRQRTLRRRNSSRH